MPPESTKPVTTSAKEKPSAEAAALMTLAKGQKALHRLAQYWLKHDKADGIRFVHLLEQHGDLFRAAKDEIREMVLVDDEVIQDMAWGHQFQLRERRTDPTVQLMSRT